MKCLGVKSRKLLVGKAEAEGLEPPRVFPPAAFRVRCLTN